VSQLKGGLTAMRGGFACIALILVVASCGGSCGGQPAAQPIEGYWSWEGNGVQQIRNVGSTNFEGTIVQASTTSPCAAPVGRVVLKLTGSSNRYTGQDEWFRDSDCARLFSNDAVINLINGNKTAHLCSTGPFTDVTPVSNCVDLSRILNFKQQ
jgi:hypothetical protein